jgi:hypothetical protein
MLNTGHCLRGANTFFSHNVNICLVKRPLFLGFFKNFYAVYLLLIEKVGEINVKNNFQI